MNLNSPLLFTSFSRQLSIQPGLPSQLFCTRWTNLLGTPTTFRNRHMSGAIYWGSIGARSTILTWSVSENRHKVSQVLSAKVPVLISFKIPERRKEKRKVWRDWSPQKIPSDFETDRYKNIWIWVKTNYFYGYILHELRFCDERKKFLSVWSTHASPPQS